MLLGIGCNKLVPSITLTYNFCHFTTTREELIHNNETWNLNIMFEKDCNLRGILRYDEIEAKYSCW